MKNTMAFSKLLCVVALAIFLATEVSSLKTVSLNFTKSTSAQESGINLQGDATLANNGVISLTTRTGWSTGRALFTTPVPLWDKTTGDVADFIAFFSFVVSNVSGYPPADGLIFFLGPPNTQIPNNSTGGRLGVVDGNNAFNHFVGIEFDSHVNDWDPNYAHIGIDVGTLISLKTVRWRRLSGSLVSVTITYDSSSKTLSVLVIDDGLRVSTVSQVVDFKAVLPEVVWVGLSATSTSGGRQTHDIHSWNFTSISDNSEINLASYA